MFSAVLTPCSSLVLGVIYRAGKRPRNPACKGATLPVSAMVIEVRP